MTALQLLFVVALSGLLVGAVAFIGWTVRTALVSRGTAAAGGWLERVGQSGRRDAQRWAFVAHRATGVAVFAFLLLHVFDVSLVALSAERFDDVHDLYGSAPMRVFECLLLYAILFHTFNGVRLVLLDLVELDARSALRLLQVAVVSTVLLGTAAAFVILRPVWA
jgi:succinate dehydrogenase / fumarate reductase cytochrome b subunit